MSVHPRYPIYIPSKSRYENCKTAKMFDADNVRYHVVVEPQDEQNYAEVLGKDKLIVLPENNKGLVFARNFCKEHSITSGAERHWQFDDDISCMRRIYKGYRLPCGADLALSIAEDFVDRYENVGLCAFNDMNFLPMKGVASAIYPPFYLNTRCYTCFLMLNSLPNKWRHRYNEDTDMTLQVIADGWCTILFNAFHMDTDDTNSGGKVVTKKGGQQSVYADDGRLKMARDLERVWPHVVTTRRRFGRPQHKVRSLWRKFDTPLKRRKDIDWKKIEEGGHNEYGMELKVISPPKSNNLQKLIEDEKS